MGPKHDSIAEAMAGAIKCSSRFRKRGPPASSPGPGTLALLGPHRTDSSGPAGGDGARDSLAHPPSLRRAVLSCALAPPRQGNCTLELQSDCLAQQLNAREMEQKAATSHWPRPCRESGMHTCPGRAWLCAHAHVLTLTLSVSGCTMLTSAARPYPQLCLLLFFTCPCDPRIPMTPCPYDSVSPCLCVHVSPRPV